MLWKAISLGSQSFHAGEPLNSFYDLYLEEKRWPLWESLASLNEGEIARLILFLNQWRTHYEDSPSSRSLLLDGIRRAFPLLQALAGDNLLHLNFAREVLPGILAQEAVEQVFEAIASCGRRYESTGASKIIHTINPHLFVMWDTAICGGYAVNGRRFDYAHRFLPRVQKLAKRAICEHTKAYGTTEAEAVEALCACGHTLAKVMDEYNYAKFTMRKGEVWEAELAWEED